MTTTKKLLLATVFTTLLTSAGSHAANDKLTLGGSINLQYGQVKQKRVFRTPTPGEAAPFNRQDGFFSDTLLILHYDAHTDSTWHFGGELKLWANPTAAKSGESSNGKNAYLYIQEDNMGRFEMGSTHGASIKMQKGAVPLAKATGGIDGDYGYYVNGTTIDGLSVGNIFIEDPYLPIGCECTIRANKFSYYTPKLEGVQFGISYTPDISVRKTVAEIFDTTKSIIAAAGKNPLTYKNVWEGGVSYEKDISDYKIEFAALGQLADSKRIEAPGTNRRALRAWEVSGNLHYKEFSIGAAYGDWTDSGTSIEKISGNKYEAHYYTLGAAYSGNKLGASVTYLRSSRAGGPQISATDLGPEFSPPGQESSHNVYSVISYGLEYIAVPGIKPYIELSQYKHDRIDTIVDNNGDVILIGTVFAF